MFEGRRDHTEQNRNDLPPFFIQRPVLASIGKGFFSIIARASGSEAKPAKTRT